MWFDLKPGEVNRSWHTFKEAITSRFHRQMLVSEVIHKIEARKWNPAVEIVQEYAMKKLTMMHSLQFSDKDTIHYLISGINDRAVKASAASLRSNNVDRFLDDMFHITSLCGDTPRKQYQFKSEKFKPVNQSAEATKIDNTAKDSSLQRKPFRNIECNYCHAKGHIRAECFRLKRKDTIPTEELSPVSAVNVNQEADPQDDNGTAELVARVNASRGRIIVTNNARLIVKSLNNTACNLTALLDSGSPVSFIRSKIFHNFFSSTSLKTKICSFKTLNNTIIEVQGFVNSTIFLDQLPKFQAQIKFYVFDNDTITPDLGMDFLFINKLKALIGPDDSLMDERINLFTEIASTELIDNSSFKENIQTDFGPQVTRQVIDLIQQANTTKVPPPNEKYLVTVALKDNSTFAFAPRRFAWSKRNQIREITDDY